MLQRCDVEETAAAVLPLLSHLMVQSEERVGEAKLITDSLGSCKNCRSVE